MGKSQAHSLGWPKPPRVCISLSSSVGLLSLTPCFSGVLSGPKPRPTVSTVSPRPPGQMPGAGDRPLKPLKRLTGAQFPRNTPLKQGVNEKRASAEPSDMRTRQKPAKTCRLTPSHLLWQNAPTMSTGENHFSLTRAAPVAGCAAKRPIPVRPQMPMVRADSCMNSLGTTTPLWEL